MTGRRNRAGVFLLAGILAAGGACADAEQPAATGDAGGAPASDTSEAPGAVYERNFVFASLQGDSAFIVPWLTRARARPDSMERRVEGWLTRGGVWDGFFAEQWRTPATRAPDRVLPRRGFGLLVRDDGAIDGIVFEDPPRSLEIILGDGDAPWTGARGGSFVVLTGSAYLAEQRIDGMVLDMTRASVGDVPTGGDWAFLLSGDSAHFVLAADVEHGGEAEPVYRAWGNHGGDDMQWADVGVDWRRTEAFPPARRDIPVEWDFASDDESLEGRLEAVSAEIQAGEGPGPLLPVRALYEVIGRLETPNGPFDVHGIVVHERR